MTQTPEPPKEPQPVTRVTATVLAAFLDVTERRIRQLAVEGVIPKPLNGQYPLVESVRHYVQYLREATADPTRQALLSERARLTKAKATAAEVEQLRIVGELLPADRVERQWLAVTHLIRTKLLGIPSRMAPRLSGRRPIEIFALLTTEIHDALTALSNTDPDVILGKPRRSRPRALKRVAHEKVKAIDA